MMFDDLDSGTLDSVSPDDAFEMLRELEENRSEEIRKHRSHFRLAVKANIIAQPANSSDRLKFKLQGVTGDISESGLGAMFPVPFSVGDVFRVQFDRSKIDWPTIFARCVRCRLIREDAFEVGLLFFAPIGLPSNLIAQADA